MKGWKKFMDNQEEKKKIIQEILEKLKQETGILYNKILLKHKICTRYHSKVGGAPYLPKGIEYPRVESGEKKGKPLRLLAQINFEEMPPLEDFPTKGILQFFILDDEMYGIEEFGMDKQNHYRIIYHETVDRICEQQEVPKDIFISTEDGLFQNIDDEFQILFEQKKMGITMGDFQSRNEYWDKIIKIYNEVTGEEKRDIEELKKEEYLLLEEYLEKEEEGHRIGGYAYFTQSDPREVDEKLQDYDVLLLQLDTDRIDDIEFMWGDCGVGAFFINREDLKNRDFSKILYNWDCC